MGLGVPQAVEFYLDLKEILQETDIDLENAFSHDMQYNQKESGSISENDRVIP